MRENIILALGQLILDGESGLPAGSWAPVQRLDDEPHGDCQKLPQKGPPGGPVGIAGEERGLGRAAAGAPPGAGPALPAARCPAAPASPSLQPPARTFPSSRHGAPPPNRAPGGGERGRQACLHGRAGKATELTACCLRGGARASVARACPLNAPATAPPAPPAPGHLRRAVPPAPASVKAPRLPATPRLWEVDLSVYSRCQQNKPKRQPLLSGL